MADLSRVRNLFHQIEIGERGADVTGFGDDAGNTEPDVVGAFVAHHLQRHARHHLALKSRRAIGVHHGAAQGGQKSGRGGAEPHAHDIGFHRLSFSGHGLSFCTRFLSSLKCGHHTGHQQILSMKTVQCVRTGASWIGERKSHRPHQARGLEHVFGGETGVGP